MAFIAIEEIINLCTQKNIPFWEAILQDDCEERKIATTDSYQMMEQTFQAILDSAQNYEGTLFSKSKLVGGDGAKAEAYRNEGNSYCGDFVGQVIAEALKMGESNACMKRIVAAPTAGSCGVLPAVLVPLYQRSLASHEECVKALYVAAGIGSVIAHRAYIAGAAGGCQAEIGAASAMAAGALTYLKKGTLSQIENAIAISLKSLLGLVCDPVAGLVEVPCVKRNVIGAVNALTAADMALAGIASKIPVDQVIDAMKEIGDAMHPSLKETGTGGLAGSKKGVEIAERFLQ